MLSRTPDCLSRLAIDQLLNGELEPTARRAHRARCARCIERIAAHRAERAAFAVPRARHRWIAPVLALAAAVTVWLIDPRDATRSKGKPALGFYVKHGAAVRPGGDGELVAPGDALDFTAASAEPAYLAIVSVDGARQVSVYYPAGPTAAPLAAGPEQVLPLSVRLDGVLGVERVTGAFCDHPAEVAALAEAIARGAAVPGCTSTTLTIVKR
jgi:hypothetical protein